MLMRAAVLRQLNAPLSIETLKIPELGHGQVMLKMDYWNLRKPNQRDLW